MSLVRYFIQGNQPGLTVRGVRAFKITGPSINGASWQEDGSQAFPIVSGQLVEFQPRHGFGPPGRSVGELEIINELRKMTAAIKGEAPPEELAADPLNPKLYPEITFNNGTNSMPLVAVCDVNDGNPYVPGSLGLTDTVPIAQEWDQIPYGTSGPALNGSTAGINGVPIFTKDQAGRLEIPTSFAGILTVVTSTGLVQIGDTTPAGGAAVNVAGGTSGGTFSAFNHILCRIAGLTPASTRRIQLLGVRSDLSTILITDTPFGAAITDFDFACGTGDTIPAAPSVGTAAFAGFSYGGMLPANWQINLTAGAAGDNPRVTVWARMTS